MKILKLINTSALILIYLSSCKKPIENQKSKNNKLSMDTISTVMNNNLPYNSDSVKQFYKLDTDSISYIVNTMYKGLTSNNFDEKNQAVPLKENDFEIKLDPKYKYYTIETFKFPDYNTLKLIIYNTYGENDSKVLNVQLNSYINNVLIDQLLLDCRFTFETEYFRTFIIDKKKHIKLVKYSVDNLEFNESGDITGEKKLADATNVIVNYTIDSTGKFIKN